MKLLTYFLTFLLFLGPVVLAVLGIPVEGDRFKTFYLYPSFYVLIVFVSIAYLQRSLDEKKYRYAIWIIFVAFAWFAVNKVLGRFNSKMILFNSMGLPAMYYIFYQYLEGVAIVERSKIKKLILVMFAINGLMAVHERLTLNLFFPFDLIRSDFTLDLDTDDTIFRSAALLGHPLTNALLMSIIMVFILTSRMKPFLRYVLYLLGFFSLFCFNSRASIMFSAATFALYAIRPLFQKKTSWGKRFLSLFLLAAFAAVGLYLLQAGYGGRFEEQGDFSEDSSTLARIEVWGIFSQYGLTNFLWGMSGKDVEEIALGVMGITHIENWFILSTMIVGLIVTILVVVLFIPLYRISSRPFDRYTSFLIFFTVIGLASTNNSLACGVPALSFYFACCYAFKPEVKALEYHKDAT